MPTGDAALVDGLAFLRLGQVCDDVLVINLGLNLFPYPLLAGHERKSPGLTDQQAEDFGRALVDDLDRFGGFGVSRHVQEAIAG